MSHVYHEPLPSSPQEHEEGELLPEGFHDVIIEGHEIKAGDPESEMSWDVMNIKVRVLNGPAKGQAHTERIGLPHEGEKTGWQRNRTLFLRRLGFIKDADYAAGRISVDYEALPLKGKTCTIEIVHREGKKGDRKFANGHSARAGYGCRKCHARLRCRRSECLASRRRLPQARCQVWFTAITSDWLRAPTRPRLGISPRRDRSADNPYTRPRGIRG